MTLDEQLGQMWTQMLQQMTAAGASRQEVIAVTMSTACTILDQTGRNLWPEDLPGTPTGEVSASLAFRDAVQTLREALEAFAPPSPSATEEDPAPE